MSQNKLNALIALAKVVPNDEFTQKATAAMPTKLREALERKRKEQEDRATEEAAEAIMEAVQAAEETKSVLIEKIRSARRLIDDCKKQLDKIDLTISYGHETQNYLPLVHHVLGAGLGKSIGQWSFNFNMLLNNVDNAMGKAAFVVPAGWTPTNKSVEQKDEEAGAA